MTRRGLTRFLTSTTLALVVAALGSRAEAATIVPIDAIPLGATPLKVAAVRPLTGAERSALARFLSHHLRSTTTAELYRPADPAAAARLGEAECGRPVTWLATFMTPLQGRTFDLDFAAFGGAAPPAPAAYAKTSTSICSFGTYRIEAERNGGE